MGQIYIYIVSFDPHNNQRSAVNRIMVFKSCPHPSPPNLGYSKPRNMIYYNAKKKYVR